MSKQTVELTVYIPEVPFEPAQSFIKDLHLVTQGSTCTEGTGVWLSQEGEPTFDEVVVLVTVLEWTPENAQFIQQLAQKYKLEAKQEAVLYTIKPVTQFLI